jgi:hypothetical protein
MISLPSSISTAGRSVCLRIVRIRWLEVFPHVTQITFGGGPYRRRPIPVKQVQKVAILAHHDDVRFPRGLKYLLVFGIAQASGPNGLGVDIIVGAVDPSGEGWRELRVNPDLGHAANTG